MSTGAGNSLVAYELADVLVSGLQSTKSKTYKLPFRLVTGEGFANSPVPLTEDIQAIFPQLKDDISFDVDIPVVSAIIGCQGTQGHFYHVYRSFCSPSGLVVTESPLGFSISGSPLQEIPILIALRLCIS